VCWLSFLLAALWLGSFNITLNLAVVNTLTDSVELYETNVSIRGSGCNLLGVHNNTAILALSSAFVYLLDLSEGRIVHEVFCPYPALLSIEDDHILLRCDKSLDVVDLTSFDTFTVHSEMFFRLIGLAAVGRDLVVIGYTEGLPLGIGIYVLNVTSGRFWYRTLGLINYTSMQDPGRVSVLGRYVLLLLHHREESGYMGRQKLVDRLALVAVDPRSEEYGVAFIESNGKILAEFSSIVNGHLLTLVVKDGKIYLEVLRISVAAETREPQILSVKYVNTIATVTATETKTVTTTKYTTLTSTATITVTKTSAAASPITRWRTLWKTRTLTVTELATTTATTTETETFTTTVHVQRFDAAVVAAAVALVAGLASGYAISRQKR
jgi:hypothetical protein